MFLPALHPGGGNAPHGTFQIDLLPFGAAQLARPHEHVRRQLEGNTRDGDALAFIAVDGAQQVADELGLEDGGVVLRLALGQGAAQVARRIAWGNLVGHREAKHLADELQRPVRLLVVLGRLIGPHGVEDLVGLDIGNRTMADRACRPARETTRAW